ncbi:hypothetical protein [Streptomyces sp. NPDC003522]
MATTLITGDNRGLLGHEIARGPVQAGRTVWIGALDAGNGRKAADRLGVIPAFEVSTEPARGPWPADSVPTDLRRSALPRPDGLRHGCPVSPTA